PGKELQETSLVLYDQFPHCGSNGTPRPPTQADAVRLQLDPTGAQVCQQRLGLFHCQSPQPSVCGSGLFRSALASSPLWHRPNRPVSASFAAGSCPEVPAAAILWATSPFAWPFLSHELARGTDPFSRGLLGSGPVGPVAWKGEAEVRAKC